MRSILAVALFATLAGCSTNELEQTLLAGRPIDAAAVSAAEVMHETIALERGDFLIYRAPVLRLLRSVDLRRGGPLMGTGLGQVDVARSGYLFAERKREGRETAFFAAFQWDLVDGENRYAKVELADGTAIRFRTATARPDPCVPNCLPISQTVIAEIPEAALRGAAVSGLQLTMTLDNGYSFPVTAPAPYVAGFLAAVDAHAGD